MACVWRLVLVVGLCVGSWADPDDMMVDAFTFWNTFRDPANGLYCDAITFNDSVVCGPEHNLYSSAGTGMGLIADAVFTELGLISAAEGRRRSLQTLESLHSLWPVEASSGFFVHFTDRQFQATSEFSTVDTAEMVMGGLFAGNYFGGDVHAVATAIARNISWSVAIKAEDKPTIFPVINGSTGVPMGDIRPFNEYYIVAYVAALLLPDSKATRYFDAYMGQDGPPSGRDSYPVHKNYWGFDLLTDNNSTFMSSFIPQFCWFQTKGFHTNAYYSQTLFPAWLQADMKYWSLALDESSRIWGKPVYGKVFGAGAGASPHGYHVERIDESEDLVVSAAIMAGFLGAADTPTRQKINAQLRWLYDNDVCAYTKILADASQVKVLWRCSVAVPDWHAERADSIDFSTMVLGYAVNFLPPDFYSKFAA